MSYSKLEEQKSSIKTNFPNELQFLIGSLLLQNLLYFLYIQTDHLLNFSEFSLWRGESHHQTNLALSQ